MLVNSVCAVSFFFSNLILELDQIEMPMMIRVLIGFDFLFLRSTDYFKKLLWSFDYVLMLEISLT